ncbi:cationic amino acid transporter 1 [Elysia marginata]|uniref:Cationic amino acid transporter 1 n=1 Tax=Elysia marginata TaxID=1093978 RepID=A0AAV4J961_9GAST|nr:cationic amino acid transporter 1 [Elysia marginata]
MCPYYLLDPNAALPAIFERAGWGVARYLVAVGALSALLTSITGQYVCAGAQVNFTTPLSIAGQCVRAGAQVNFTTLFSITGQYETDANLPDGDDLPMLKVSDYESLPSFSLTSLVSPGAAEPTALTARITKLTMGVLIVFILGECLVLVKLFDKLETHCVWVVVLACVMGLGVLVCCVIIVRQPQSQAKLSFKVPLVPWIPILSVMVNIYLMLKLSDLTWARFAGWMFIGFLIYFGYGIRTVGTPPASLVNTLENGTPSSLVESHRLLPQSTITKDGKYTLQ